MHIADRFRGFLPVVIDIETSGFNPQTDALLQIASVMLRMDESGRLEISQEQSVQVLPFEGANLEAASLEFTGIMPFDKKRNPIEEAQALKSILKPIRSAVKEFNCTRAIIVAHNAHFDLSFINSACARCNNKKNPFHSFSCFDTVSLAGLIYGQTVLAQACKAANIEFDNERAHSAAYDARKTAELFCNIINLWYQKGGFPAF